MTTDATFSKATTDLLVAALRLYVAAYGDSDDEQVEAMTQMKNATDYYKVCVVGVMAQRDLPRLGIVPSGNIARDAQQIEALLTSSLEALPFGPDCGRYD